MNAFLSEPVTYRINESQLAQLVKGRWGDEAPPIHQIREVIGHALDLLAECPASAVLELVEKHQP